MSTQYRILQRRNEEIEVNESSAMYDLDSYYESGERHQNSLQYMTSSEAITVALGLLYAVWCQHPDEVESKLKLAAKDICNWKEISSSPCGVE